MIFFEWFCCCFSSCFDFYFSNYHGVISFWYLRRVAHHPKYLMLFCRKCKGRQHSYRYYQTFGFVIDCISFSLQVLTRWGRILYFLCSEACLLRSNEVLGTFGFRGWLRPILSAWINGEDGPLHRCFCLGNLAAPLCS